jgi:hypothetical protein
MNSEQWFQLGLVAIGAIATIVGSLAGAFLGAIYQARLNRPRLKVDARWGFGVFGPGVTADYAIVRAANVGPLPMQVTGCGLRLNGEKQLTVIEDEIKQARLPADLLPGQSVAMHISLEGIKRQLQEQSDRGGVGIEVVGAYADDATGKRWIGPTLNLKGLRFRPRRG